MSLEQVFLIPPDGVPEEIRLRREISQIAQLLGWWERHRGGLYVQTWENVNQKGEFRAQLENSGYRSELKSWYTGDTVLGAVRKLYEALPSGGKELLEKSRFRNRKRIQGFTNLLKLLDSLGTITESSNLWEAQRAIELGDTWWVRVISERRFADNRRGTMRAKATICFGWTGGREGSWGAWLEMSGGVEGLKSEDAQKFAEWNTEMAKTCHMVTLALPMIYPEGTTPNE